MAFDAHRNFAYSTVATAPAPTTTGTTLVLAAGDGAKFTAPCNLAVWPTGVMPLASNAEIVRLTGVGGDTLTMLRAQEGSPARAIVAGDQVAEATTAKAFTDIEAAITANSTAITTNAAAIAANAAILTPTTKGDMLASNAAHVYTRLPVGADGQVLTADASQALGTKWAGVPGGGSGAVVTTIAAASGAQVLNVPAGGQAYIVTLTGNWTPTISGAVAGTECIVDLEIKSDATGGHVITWPAVSWADGNVPPTTAVGSVQLVTLASFDGGLTWLGAGPVPPGVLASTWTAKGDLIGASSASSLVRVPAGADGQVLTADSTQASGLKWGAGGQPPVPVAIALTGFTPVTLYGSPVSLTFTNGMVSLAGRVQATATIATGTVITSSPVGTPPTSAKRLPVMFENAAGTVRRLDALYISSAGQITYYGGGMVSGDTLSFDGLEYSSTTIASGSTFDAAVLTDSPVMYLPLGEVAGTAAADLTGNGHAGTYSGGFTLNQAGPCSDGHSAVLLDGTTGAVSVPHAAPLMVAQPLTIECWVKMTDLATYYILASKTDSATNGFVWYLNTGGALAWQTNATGGIATFSYKVPAGAWTHLAVVDTGTITSFYANGVNQGTINAQPAAVVANTLPLLIGHQNPSTWFKGAIAKVALYNTALSAARIAAHYAAR